MKTPFVMIMPVDFETEYDNKKLNEIWDAIKSFIEQNGYFVQNRHFKELDIGDIYKVDIRVAILPQMRNQLADEGIIRVEEHVRDDSFSNKEKRWYIEEPGASE